MAATQPQAPGPAAEDKPADPDNMKEQCNTAGSEMPISSSALNSANIALPIDSTNQLQPSGSGGEQPDYSTNIYAPQAQALFYRGFDNAHSEWDEYMPFVHPEGLEIGSPGVYNDNSSLLFHSGFGYGHQMPYGPYSPVTTPLPSVGGDQQMYSPQQFSYSGPPYYQPLVSPTMPYVTSPMPVSQPDFTNLASVDQQGDRMLFGSRPVYSPAGPFNGGSFPGGSGTFSFHDSQQGFNGLGLGGLWSDCSKPSDRLRSLVPFSPSPSPQPIGPVASFGQSIGVTSQQPKSYGNFYGRGYIPNHGTSFAGSHISSLGTVSRSWSSLENSRRRVRGGSSLYSCNGTLDVLMEQNRGPRASKTKSQVSAENGSSVEIITHSTSVTKIHNESFNLSDFVTEYKDAKFFVIKSYSEDNVHKSIKYGVWASTPNGNRKLDAAYRQAKEMHDICPVFLFFSVNASAQFCGVAEMIGSVDFDKSVDYWQHDKWTGQFPVRWHIIKDVPNSQFRHIVLENNDNKPVTNSRDTQEVKLEQGIEILNIFKNYENDTSILDDFDFYEQRQKAMQERKARHQVGMMAVGVTEGSDNENAATLSGGFIKQMSKSFAEVVCLDKRSKETTVAEKGSSVPSDSKVLLAKFDDDTRVPISSTKPT